MPKRLNVDALAAPDMELEIDGQVFSIRGRLSVDEMVELMTIEKRIRSLSADNPDDGQEILEAASAANQIALRLIHERHPDATPTPLNVEQSAAVLSFIATEGEVDRTVEAVVQEALSAGIDPEAIAKREANKDVGAAVEESLGKPVANEPVDEAPLPPPSGSLEPSSTSEPPTDGRQSGGETAPGELSASTSATTTQPVSV